MSVTALKLLFAVFTLSLTAFVIVVTRRGADPTWAIWGYLVSAGAFTVAIIIATLKAAKTGGAVTLRRLRQLFISFGTAFPVVFSLWIFWQHGPLTAGLAFMLASAAIALWYVLMQAFRHAQRALSKTR